MTASRISESPAHIPALDGWRGLAITLVLLGHFGVDQRYAWCSTLGVYLFFALSGRLMADILFIRRMPLPTFFARRFARVYPTLLCCVLLSLILTQGTMLAFDPLTALLALSFTLNYAVAHGYQYTSLDHIWSLCVEEHSYVLLAVIALACRTLGARSAGWLTLAIGMAAIANGVAQLEIFHRDTIAVLWRTDTTMAGIFVAVGFRLLSGSDRSTQEGWRWLSPLAMLGAVLASALGTAAVVYFGIKTILLALSVTRVEDAWQPMRTLLETRSLQFLGQRSFSIYLYQEFFFRLAHAGGMPMFPFLVLSLAVGLLGYYLIERPLRSACAARLSRHAMLHPSAG